MVNFLIKLSMTGILIFLFMTDAKSQQIEDSYKIRTIVIDPGHGGRDHGCSGASSSEKHVALDLALKLGKLIENEFPDINVIFTRKTDVFVELQERARIANKNNADLFISIHLNAAASRNAYGTETYVMGLHRSQANLEVAKRENASILFEENYEERYNYDPNSPTSHILFSLHASANLDQSILLAEKIEHEFKTYANRHSRGVKQAGFLVLHQTNMPSVLIEAGFLTNRTEETFLISDRGKNLIAGAIFNGIKNYKENIEGNSKLIATNGNGNKTTEIPTPAVSQEHVAEVERADDAIEFRIQFLATNVPIDVQQAPYNRLSDIHFEKLNNGMIRYFSGRYFTASEAQKALREVKSRGFNDAFLTAYQNGKQVNIQNALNSVK